MAAASRARTPGAPTCGGRRTRSTTRGASSWRRASTSAANLARIVSLLRRHAFALAASALCFAWFLGLELAHWNQGLATSFDLGIFSQSAQGYATGGFPVSHLRGLNLLGDHFSPITALGGLAWRLWPDPRSLLVLQAACLAAGVALMGGLTRTTLPHLPLAGPAVVALGALGGQVVPSALFDVHEVSYGLPIVAVMCRALLLRHPRQLLVAGALLVLVKEDLGATVVVAGLVWLLRARAGSRWVAAAVAGVGVAGLVVAALTIAHFSPTGGSPYTARVLPGIGNWASFVYTVAYERTAPVVVFALAAGLVGLASPLALLAAPTLAWRLTSTVWSHWRTEFHYDLLLWPIAVAALLEVVGRFSSGPESRRLARAAAVPVVLALTATVVLGVAHIERRGVRFEGLLGEGALVADLRAAAAAVPAGATVAAQNDLGPYLVATHDVYHLAERGDSSGPAEYAILTVDGRSPYSLTPCARAALDAAVREGSARTVARQGAVVALRFPTRQQLSLSRGCP